MKCNFEMNIGMGKLTFVLEGDQKAIVEQMSELQEVFGHEPCPLADGGYSDNIVWRVREIDENKFYEKVCLDNGYKLAFGTHKKGGTLFPKRKDNDGNWLPLKGWHKWVNPNASQAKEKPAEKAGKKKGDEPAF